MNAAPHSTGPREHTILLTSTVEALFSLFSSPVSVCGERPMADQSTSRDQKLGQETPTPRFVKLTVEARGIAVRFHIACGDSSNQAVASFRGVDRESVRRYRKALCPIPSEFTTFTVSQTLIPHSGSCAVRAWMALGSASASALAVFLAFALLWSTVRRWTVQAMPGLELAHGSRTSRPDPTDRRFNRCIRRRLRSIDGTGTGRVHR
jgi:hypothetical protein